MADGRCPWSKEQLTAAGFEVLGFDVDDTKGNPGTVLRFDAEGKPLPASGQSGAVLVKADARLKRPIGILALP